MPHITGKTGEIVKVAGVYRAISGKCVGEEYNFTVGDTFTPCHDGGDATWSLVHG